MIELHPRVYTASFSSPVGTLFLASTDDGLCKLSIRGNRTSDFDSWIETSFPDHEIVESGAKNREFISELKSYLSGSLTKFQIPLVMIGSDFQKKVWKELLKIRYGTTISYKELACRVGIPGGSQSVGRANAANPLPLVVPCHRVIGSDGSLIGYGGGIKMKEFLLRLEGAVLM